MASIRATVDFLSHGRASLLNATQVPDVTLPSFISQQRIISHT
jgi:hypothetical protein